MSFEKRRIDLTFTLGEGDFGEGGGNSVKLSGHRVLSQIIKAGGPSMGTAQLQVFGMTLEQMNKFSTLGQRPTTVRKNTIIVEAGEEDGAMATVFTGNITNAWFDGVSAPNVPFQVLAHVGGFDAINSIPPTSYRGSVDVVTILSGLATKMGKGFENNGVSVRLFNPYYTGSARDQALACVRDAGIQWNGLDESKLVIWPSGQSRGGAIPVVSKNTGMENYPTFTSQGIQVSSLFNPSIAFGGKVKVESILDGANGEWIIYSLTYNLDAQQPRGKWHMTMSGARPGFAVVAGR